MDEFRRVRFLYPPIVLVAALLLAIGPDKCFKTLKDVQHGWVGVVIGGGVVVVAAGYVIGTISIVVLRVLTCGKYEEVMDKLHVEALWKDWRRSESDALSSTDRLCVVAAFDHYVVPKRLASWLDRRWNAFNLAIHCVVALVFALLIGLCELNPSCRWCSGIIALILFFGFNAWFARQDTLRMNNFLVRTKLSDPQFTVQKEELPNSLEVGKTPLGSHSQ